MRPASRLLIAALATAALAPCGGCGGSGGSTPALAIVPVRGQILYRGKPLPGGGVTFEPVDGGREAHGGVGPDGRFTLTTFRDGDGAVRGPHRVAVTGAVPLKYRSFASSGLEIEISSERSDYILELR